MTALYDTTTPGSIPLDAPIVAGYICLPFGLWSQADWDRFPNAIKIRICRCGQDDADALDIEPGLAAPSDAPGWIDNHFRPGTLPRPLLYCNRSTWQAVRDAVGTRAVDYWISTLDESKDVLFSGASVVQYREDKNLNLDFSETAPGWPGTTAKPKPIPPGISTSEEATMALAIHPDPAQDRVDLFYIGTDHAVWRKFSDRGGSAGSWSGPISEGGDVVAVAAGYKPSADWLHIFGLNAIGQIWEKAISTADGHAGMEWTLVVDHPEEAAVPVIVVMGSGAWTPEPPTAAPGAPGPAGPPGAVDEAKIKALVAADSAADFKSKLLELAASIK